MKINITIIFAVLVTIFAAFALSGQFSHSVPVADMRGGLDTVTLSREIQMSDATLGYLINSSQPRIDKWATMEPPWRDNRRNISSIPAGKYVAKRARFLDFETFQILNIPGRSKVYFHPGNYPRDTKGCVLVGKRFAETPEGDIMIVLSKQGFDEFMKSMEGKDIFEINIEDITE